MAVIPAPTARGHWTSPHCCSQRSGISLPASRAAPWSRRINGGIEMEEDFMGPAWMLWIASRTLDQHYADSAKSWKTGNCKQCTEGGCPQLEWAKHAVEYYGQALKRRAAPSPTPG